MCLRTFRTIRDGRGRSPAGAPAVHFGLATGNWEIGFRRRAVPAAGSNGSQRGMNTDTSNTPSVLDSSIAERRRLIDVPALAIELGVTPRFVRRLVAEDRVPFLKIGKFVRFDPREIELWVDARRSRQAGTNV